MTFVPEEPLQLAPGVAEMLRDPTHYRRGEMRVIDYEDLA